MKTSHQKDKAMRLAGCTREQLGAMLANVLGARQCVVHAPIDDDVAELCDGLVAAFGEIHASSHAAIVEYGVARDRMFSILKVDGAMTGFVQVCGPRRRPQFTDLDLQLLRIMSAFVAEAIDTDCRQTQGDAKIGPA
jgi:hypothetical protein